MFQQGFETRRLFMKLKRFAVLALAFTTASGFTMEPLQTATAVASEVVSEMPVPGEDGTASYTDTDAGGIAVNATDEANSTESNTNIETPDDTESQTTQPKKNKKNTKGKKTNKNKKIKKSKKAKKNTKRKAVKNRSKKNYTKADLRLMSSIINCEAGNEPYQGKLAVGIVVMNRIKSKVFPNTLKGVIYQPGQFSPVRNGSLRRMFSAYDSGRTNSKQWKSCISAARKVLNGQRTILYRGKEKNMKSFHFFSMGLSGARFRLGGHKFK